MPRRGRAPGPAPPTSRGPRSASSSSPTAISASSRSPSSSRIAGSSTIRVANLVRAPQVRERGRGFAEGQLDEAEHPAVTRLRDPDALRLGARDRALRALARASSIRPRCAAITAAGSSPRGAQSTELRLELQRVGRVPRLPAPSSPPATRGSSGARRASAILGVVPSVRGAPQLHGGASRARSTSPDHQSWCAERDRRPVVERPLGQRPLERERLVHLRAWRCRARREVRTSVCRECAAAQRDVVDARGGIDGQLAVLDAALDALAERIRSARPRWIAPRAHRRPRPPRAPRGRAQRRSCALACDAGRGAPGRLPARSPARQPSRALLEQRDRSIAVAGAVVHVGGEQ